MTDLLQVLPNFPTNNYTHLIPSLERNYITTTDLLTLDALDVAKRARLPLLDLRKLTDHVLSALRDELGVGKHVPTEFDPPNSVGVQTTLRTTGTEVAASRPLISTLDPTLDAALSGGVPTGYIMEIVGESGAGKTQLLLTLLLSAQLPAPLGLSRPTLYISTEGPLATSRLAQILSTHHILLEAQPAPSLSRVHSIQTPDLESQEHIITFQVPVVVERENIGLVVIDSIAANYRAERLDSDAGSGMAERSEQLTKLGAQLRSLARVHNCAVVVANQVSDRFEPLPTTATRSSTKSQVTSSPYQPSLPLPNKPKHCFSPLALDHQLRFFSGWGSDAASSAHGLKNPALGLIWANQIACRIALIKEPCFRNSKLGNLPNDEVDSESVEWSSQTWRRWMKVAFATWAESTPDAGRGVEFEIWRGGLRTTILQKTNID